MIAIKAMIKNGYLVSVNPVDLPEGSQLEVTAADPCFSDDEQMTEANWPRTPEGIAALLARMDSRQPLVSNKSDHAEGEARALSTDLPKGTPVYGRGKGKVIQMIDDEEHLKDFAEYMP